VLCLAPHPDDESCGIGGTLALHRAQGDALAVVFLTDGRSGDPDARFDGDLTARRQDEARAAIEVLGGGQLYFLGLPDGHEASPSDLEMVADLLQPIFSSFAPATVYVPWPGEAHADHAASRAALDVLLLREELRSLRDSVRILEYEVWSPLPADYVIDITSTAEKKHEAMLCHASQVSYTDYPHQLLGLCAHRSVYLPKDSRYGEAFREGTVGEAAR